MLERGTLYTYICRVESLNYSPKTITALLIGYTPVQNKKFKREENSGGCRVSLDYLLMLITCVLWSRLDLIPKVPFLLHDGFFLSLLSFTTW